MFKNLVFKEKEHHYFVNGEQYPSVSSKLSQYYKPFDKSIAKWSAKKEGITEKQMLARWDKKSKDACDYGSSVHEFAENWMNRVYNQPSNLDELAIIEFALDIKDSYKVAYTELQMYSDFLKIAGTTDLVLQNKQTGKYVIVDFKTNANLHKNFKGKKLLTPFSSMLETPLNKYKIQLNYYQIMLEEAGLDIEDRWVIWTKRNKTKYYTKYTIPNYTQRIINYENRRHRKLN